VTRKKKRYQKGWTRCTERLRSNVCVFVLLIWNTRYMYVVKTFYFYYKQIIERLTYYTVWLDDFSCDHCIVNHFSIVPPVCPLLIASSILSNVYIFHENMYLQNLRTPVLHVQTRKEVCYYSCNVPNAINWPGASFVSYSHTSFFKNHKQNNFVHNYQVQGHTSFLVCFRRGKSCVWSQFVMHTSIMCINILQNIKAVAPKL
jgi:hypothetical protein